MKPRTLICCATLVCLLVLSGCGGSGGMGNGTTSVPPPPIALTVIIQPPGTTTVPADGKTVVPLTANVTVQNATSTSPVPTWQWTATSGIVVPSTTTGETSAVSWTSPSSVPAQDPAEITATASYDNVVSPAQTVKVMVTAAQVAPTGTVPAITVTATNAVVPLGGTETVSFVVTGNPVPQISCADQYGAMAISGNTASAVIPQTAPVAPLTWLDAPACTAVNSAGQAEASAKVTLQYPPPTLASVSPDIVFCPFPGCVVGTTLVGSGFYAGGTITIAHPGSTVQKTQTVTLPSGVAPTEYPLADNYIFDPGWTEYSVASPATGNGGGTSDTITVLFTGNTNSLALMDTTGVAQFDQGGKNVLWFSLPDLTPAGNFLIGGQALAYDNGPAKTLLVSEPVPYVIAIPSTYAAAISASAVGVAAENGLAVFAEYSKNTVGSFTVSTTSNSVPSYTTVPGTPWDVAMTSLNSAPVAIVLSVETGTLSTLDLSTNVVTGTATLPHFTSFSELPPGKGGWDLAVAGPDAWVLSDLDATATLVDLGTMSVVKQIALSGAPFRISINAVDGSAVVALADLVNVRTTFVRVDAQGDATPLTATFKTPCTGFKVSADGGTLYCGNAAAILKAVDQ